jgi:hypothetical protein
MIDARKPRRRRASGIADSSVLENPRRQSDADSRDPSCNRHLPAFGSSRQ